MGTQQILPIILFSAHAMTSSFNSSAIGINWEDNIGLQWTWTGTPTGVFTIQVSMDPTLLGWISLPTTGYAQPAGSGDTFGVDFNQTAFAYIRLAYTATSGSGSVTCKIAGKSV